MSTPLLYTIEIDVTSQTTATDLSIGLVAGVFKWVSGSQIVNSFYPGILLDDDISVIDSLMNLNKGGAYSTYSSFSFSVDNTSAFWVTVESIGISFIKRPVKVSVILNNISYTVYFGVIDEDPRDLVSYKFELISNFRNIHKPICDKKINTLLLKTAKIQSSVKDSVIPVTLGKVPNAKAISVSKDYFAYELGGVDPVSLVPNSTSPIIDKTILRMSMVAPVYAKSTSTTPAYLKIFTFAPVQKDELKGAYVLFVKNGAPDGVYYITGNDKAVSRTDYPGTEPFGMDFKVYLDQDLPDNTTIKPYTKTYPSHRGGSTTPIADVTLLKIIRFDRSFIVSEKPIEKYLPSQTSNRDFVLKQKFTDKSYLMDIVGAVNEAPSTTNINNLGVPGFLIVQSGSNELGMLKVLVDVPINSITVMDGVRGGIVQPAFDYSRVSKYQTFSSLGSNPSILTKELTGRTYKNVIYRDDTYSGSDFPTTKPSLTNRTFACAYLVKFDPILKDLAPVRMWCTADFAILFKGKTNSETRSLFYSNDVYPADLEGGALGVTGDVVVPFAGAFILHSGKALFIQNTPAHFRTGEKPEFITTAETQQDVSIVRTKYTGFEIIKNTNVYADEQDYNLSNSMMLGLKLKHHAVRDDKFSFYIYAITITAECNIKVLDATLFTDLVGQVWSSTHERGYTVGYAPISPSELIEYLLREYDGIGNTITSTYLPAKVNSDSFNDVNNVRSSWIFGKQLAEKKFTYEYMIEILQQSFIGMHVNSDGALTVFDITTAPKSEKIINETNMLTDGMSAISKTPVSEVYLDITLNYGWNPASETYDKSYGILNVDADRFPYEYETETTTEISTGTNTSIFPVPGTAYYEVYSSLAVVGTKVWVQLEPLKYKVGSFKGKYFSLKDTNNDGEMNFYCLECKEEIKHPTETLYIDTLAFFVAGDISNLYQSTPSFSVTSMGTLLLHDAGVLLWRSFAPGYGEKDYSLALKDWTTLNNSYKKIGTINKLPSELANCSWIPDLSIVDSEAKPTTIIELFNRYMSWVTFRKEKVTVKVKIDSDTITWSNGTYVQVRHPLHTLNEYRHGIVQRRKLNILKAYIELEVLIYDTVNFNFIDGGYNTEPTDLYDGGYNAEVTNIIDGGI